MKYDFWYSEKQKHCSDIFFPPMKKLNLFIQGREFTECFESGKGHTHNWDDGVFIGTFELNEATYK